MRKFAIVSIVGAYAVLGIAGLVAQQAQAQQPQAEYMVKLTAPEWDLIGRALGKEPYNDVYIVVAKLRQQLSPPPAEPKKD